MSWEKVFDQVQELIRRPSNTVQVLCGILERECRAAEINIEDAKFLPFFFYLTPFSADNYLSPVDTPELIYPTMKRFVQEQAKTTLATKQTVSLNTLKLQFFYSLVCFDLKEIVVRTEKEIHQKSRFLSKKFLRNTAKTIESRERLLSLITQLTVIDNGIGETSDSRQVRETEAAVKSVLSGNDLDLLAKLKKRDKLNVLEDLKLIVCGIRLFDCDAGNHFQPVEIIDRE